MHNTEMKKALIKSGQSIAGLNSTEIETAYTALQGTPPAPTAAPAPTAPTAPTAAPAAPAAPIGPIEQAVASIIDDRLKLIESEAVNENQIIDLIKSHATIQHNVKVTLSGKTKTIENVHESLKDLITFLLVENVYLVGGAGGGKTTMAHQAAEALGRDFYFLGAILQKFELVGFVDAVGNYHTTPFREAFEKGGVFLMDEGDACSPEALVAINAATANGSYTFPDDPKAIKKHDDFVMIMAANTIGLGATRAYAGRNPLDGATLDRFIQLEIGYSESIEKSMAVNAYQEHGGQQPSQAIDWCDEVRAFRKKCSDLSYTIIISPRATKQGAGLLARGVPIEQVREVTMYKHLAIDQRNQLKVS